MQIERSAFYQGELRASIGPTLRITGHAAVFNQLSENLGGFREKIQPGAFADTINTADVRALWNHDPNFILARTANKTLKLSEDGFGLHIDAELLDSTFERELLKKIESRLVDQMSFGFRVLPSGDKWEMHEGQVIRTLIKVELFDVSPVTFPAYPQTDVQARSALFETKIGGLSAPEPENIEAEFLARMKKRQEFVARRTPAPDPLSFAEIIRKARITPIGG